MAKTEQSQRFSADPEGWVHIAALGEYPQGIPNANGLTTYVQVVDASACADIVQDWVARGKPELLLDYDHAGREGGSTIAAGWIQALEARLTGLWGKVRWSDRGKADVEGGNYRYISSVWEVRKIAGTQVRPVRLLECTVTNQPNIPGLFPISNSSRRKPEQVINSTQKPMQAIAQLLGLAPEATEEQILAKIRELVQKPADTTMQNRCTALETEVQELRKAEIGLALDAAGISDAPTRASWETLILANRQAGLHALKVTAKPQAAPASPAAATVLSNAKTSTTAAEPTGLARVMAAFKARESK